MRALRLALAVGAAAVAVSASTSAAAPPVGCYGLPDYPSVFLCVTSFTPENAVPTAGTGPGSTVYVPRFCAGECYGPIPVPVPGAGVQFGTGSVAVVTYNGQTYVIAVGGGVPPLPPVGVPPVPPLPEPQAGSCPGSQHGTRLPNSALGTVEPAVCARSGYSSTYGSDAIYVGTCVTPDCTVLEIPAPAVQDAVAQLVADVKAFVRDHVQMQITCPAQAPLC